MKEVHAIDEIPSCRWAGVVSRYDEEPFSRRAIIGVVECDVPHNSALGKDLIERADFRDAYRAPLSRSDLGVVEILFAIFAHRPGWMNLMLIARNKAGALAGLEVPTTAEIINMEKRDRYFVGEKIGPWPIFFLGFDELVAGRGHRGTRHRSLHGVVLYSGSTHPI